MSKTLTPEQKERKRQTDKARRERIKAEREAAGTPVPEAVNDEPVADEPVAEAPAESEPEKAKPVKKAKRPELAYKPKLLPGLHRTNWNRKRGTWVSVYDGKAADMDTEAGRWQVVCERHSTVNSVDTAKQGREDAKGDPAEFCAACRGDES